jgi:hypothetical protein
LLEPFARSDLLLRRELFEPDAAQLSQRKGKSC